MRRIAANAMLQQRGYTLVELATVLGVLGVLSLSMHSAIESMQQARLYNASQADAESARQALRAYLLRNKRLPCADTSSDGEHGRSDPTCTGNSGWLPYETLGLEIPERARRLRYGVYRSGLIDLTNPAASSIDEPDIEGRSALAAALTTLAKQPFDADAPWYSASVASASGSASTCQADQPTNPAFILVAPAADLDGSGAPAAGFDGPNRDFATGNGRCVAAPSRAADDHYDDVVVAESASTLLGLLTASTR